MNIVFFLILLHLIDATTAVWTSMMESLYGKELDEFRTACPEYSQGELNEYVSNTIKFLLNASPDIATPLPANHPWKHLIYTDQNYHNNMIVAPLLDHNFKPLFVKSRNGFSVPNFDLVRFSVAWEIRRGHYSRVLMPDVILRPIDRTRMRRSWVYETYKVLPSPDRRRIIDSIPWAGFKRERGGGRKPVSEQIAHPSFARSDLLGLVLADIYSPGYNGKGPRPLVRQTIGSDFPHTFSRNWDHFLAREQPPRVPELDLLSSFGSSSRGFREQTAQDIEPSESGINTDLSL